jgi:hypothetical protein
MRFSFSAIFYLQRLYSPCKLTILSLLMRSSTKLQHIGHLMFKKIIPLLLLISFNSWADNVNQIFGDGIFETNWGQSFEEVAERFPSGKIKQPSKLDLETVKDISKVFVVKDERTVLGVKRKKSHSINYNFDKSQKLKQIRVQFRAIDQIELLNTLESLLGRTNIEATRGDLAFYTRWLDDKSSISVTLFRGKEGRVLYHAYLVITKESRIEEVISKEALGF